ncbi:IS3 family transposase [Viridibacillus sp. NPDC093762]|uniref:IS3 family transposase n=1 Tax=Viridibacillus sp. NPDC093762 TaxID=3390720 RepID=UPI003CFE4D56
MGTRVSYPYEVKMKAIEMRLSGISTKQVLIELNIRNKTQVETWLRWFKNGEIHRFEQPVGKQYTFNKGPEYKNKQTKLEVENRYLKQQIEVFKKVRRVGEEVVGEVAVQLVESLKETMCVKDICTHIGVTRSTYYRWKQASTDVKSRQSIERRIGELCRKHKFRYGYRKITALLRQELRVNHKVVQRIMQKYGWQCRVKVKKRKKNGQPCHIADNLLNRNFEATAPLQRLVTDITYLPFGQKQLYLSSIQDLYNGEIIAYSIGDCQDTDFVLNTLSQLDTLPERGTLHSDQGSVYTSYRYQQAVKGKGIIMSMSHKGTPADNAPIKSFHSVLKSETFYLDNLRSTTTAIVVQTVKDYIKYYNYIRIQAKLNNQSPVQYRQLMG